MAAKKRGGYNTVQHTLITDLTEDEDAIYKRIRKNYRYEIRHIAKENVQLRYYSASDMRENYNLLQEFESTYNQMYESKGLNVKFNMPLVKKYIDENAICFTIAFHNEEPLVYHSYIIDKSNVRFFYSASPFRVKNDLATMIGQMNKALHWFDIKKFKQMGILLYDWGGIANPKEPNGIDTFKMGFGGTEKKYHNNIDGLTFLGKIIAFIVNIKSNSN